MKSDSEVILFEVKDILEQEKLRKTPIIYRPCDCWKDEISNRMIRSDIEKKFLEILMGN